MSFVDENSMTGDVRAEVAYARDNKIPVPREVAFILLLADLLQLPDDTRLIPAVSAVMKTPTRLYDFGEREIARKVAIAAGKVGD